MSGTEPIVAGTGYRRGPAGWRHYTLMLLCIVAVFNYIDRQILAILIEPVKKDLGASDTEMGLLNGLAFAVFYLVAGVPLARWADRGVRRNLVASCLAVWSVMTALCGAVQSFAQLAALRMGVAGGEAGAAPATQSMIADIYPREQRGTAVGVWIASQALGIAFGMIFGGWLVSRFNWRVAFLIVGVPGAILALIVRFTVREPVRQPDSNVAVRGANIWRTFADLWRIPSYRAALMIDASVSFTGYALLTWTPSYFIRVHHLPTATVGLFLGLATAFGLVIGNIGAGRLTDVFARRSVSAYLWIPLVGGLLSIPCGLTTTMASSPVVAMVGFFLLKLTMTAWTPSVYALTMSLAQPSQRGASVLIVTIFTNVFGMGFGVFTVGRLNDLLKPALGDGAIAWSLTIVMIGLALSCVAAAWGLRHVKQDFARIG